MNNESFINNLKGFDFLNDVNIDLEAAFEDIELSFRQLITDRDKWLQIKVLLSPFMCAYQLPDYIKSILDFPNSYVLGNVAKVKEVLSLFPENDGSLFYKDATGIIHTANKWDMYQVQTKILKILEETNDQTRND